MSNGAFRRLAILFAAVGLLILVGLSGAGAQSQKGGSGIIWHKGPTVGELGGIAKINVPAGYLFTGKAGAQRLLELSQNTSSGSEVGAIIPEAGSRKDMWFIIFEFHNVGYVRDNEKNDLNPGTLLKSIRDATEEDNKIRAQKGWGAFHVTGWELKPFYDTQTHNLTWAIRGREESSNDETVNYSTRVLGRRGTMNVDLVIDTTQETRVIPSFRKLMSGFSYLPGSRYSEFVKGDKVAKYGLTALIAGAAGAAAVKTGLLAKFWKLIVLAFAAIAGAIKKFFRSLKRIFIKAEKPERNHGPQG